MLFEVPFIGVWIAVLLNLFVLMVAYSRVLLSYHTMRQVVAGYVSGVVFSFIWFMMRRLSETWLI